MLQAFDYRLVVGFLLLAFAALPGWADTERAVDAPAEERPAEPAVAEPAAQLVPAFVPGRRLPFAIQGGIGWQAAPVAEQTEQHGGVTLATNGDLARRLERTREELTHGNVADAARQLGIWLQDRGTADFFLNRDEEGCGGRSFQSEVHRLIAQLSPTALAAYRLQFDGLASQALQSALAAGGVARLREVMRQFPRTTAGAEAAFHLGHELLDHGRPVEAAACLARLQADHELGKNLEPRLSLLLAACWCRTGQPERFAVAADAVFRHPECLKLRQGGYPLPDFAGDPHTVERLASLFGAIAVDRVDERDWLTFRGNEMRNRQVAATAPLLMPRWSVSLVSDGPALVELDGAERTLRDGKKAQIPQLQPLAVGDLVFVRTATGVAAYNADNGARLWHVPADSDDSNAGILESVWSEPAGGAFSVDTECVYYITGQSQIETQAALEDGNILSAHEHSRGRQGNVRWQIGGKSGGDEPRLAGARFLGPPLPRGHHLYIQIQLQQALHLAIVDARTGRLDWSQELALVDDEAEPDLLRQLVGVTPSIAEDELAIFPTSGGAVVAVDLTTRSLAWAYRYGGQGPSEAAAASTVIPRPDPSQQRSLDASVTIAGTSVVLAPTESSELHCVDLLDGALRWKKPREDGLFVAGIAAEAVIVIGRQGLRALKLADGEPAWSSCFTFPPGTGPSGRGVSTGDRYFLPLTNATIVEINLLDGQLNAEFRSPREIMAGNLIWHRSRFLSQSVLRLQAFDERATVARDIEEALANTPDDASTLLRRGELALADGRLDDALADFRTAYRFDRGGKARSRLISALLDALRQRPGDKMRVELESELAQVGE